MPCSLPRAMVELAVGLIVWLAAATAARGDAPAWPAIADPPTNVQVPGRWVWADLFTEDADAARRFYGQLFGWTFDARNAGEGSYAVARAGDDPVGGIMQRRHTYVQERGSRWVGMISVPDVAKAASYAAEQGGKVLVPPRNLPGRGQVAFLADPEGAPFGVIRSAAGDPPDYLGAENEWIWIELWAKDPRAMADFYAGLGGYEIDAMSLANGRAAYELSSGGYARGCIMDSSASGYPSTWVPYLRVADVNKAVEATTAAGGRVVVAPDKKLRDGSVALIADPTGAALGLVHLTEGRRK